MTKRTTPKASIPRRESTDYDQGRLPCLSGGSCRRIRLVAVAIGTKWDAGKKYIYTLDFTNGAGKVDPEKPEPTDPTDPDNPGGDIFGGAIKVLRLP